MTTGRFRRPCGAVALVGLVLLSGCAGSGDATPTTTVSPATSTTADAAVAPTSVAPTTTPTTPAPPTTTADGDASVASTDPPPATSADTSAASSTVPAADAVDWTTIVADLLRIEFELPMDPSLERIDELCTTISTCRDTWTTTVQNLLDNGWRVQGGAPYVLDSVEFQDTVDSVPLDEALAVTLIVRQTVTEQGDIVLVDADGNVAGNVEQDPNVEPGDRISRPFIVGRDTIDSPWKLVAQGAAS